MSTSNVFPRCVLSVLALAIAVPAAGQQPFDRVVESYDNLKYRLTVGPLDPNSPVAIFTLPNTLESSSLADVFETMAAGGQLVTVIRGRPSGSFSFRLNQAAFVPGMEYALYAAETNGLNFLGTILPNPLETMLAPPRTPVGADDIQIFEVAGGSEVIFLNGPGPEDDIVEFVPSHNFPLITALKGPGSQVCAAQTAPANTNPVIGIYGRIVQGSNANQFGGGESDCKSYLAYWADLPMRFTVIGRTPDATIQQVGFSDTINGIPTGGVADARFEDLTIEAKFSSAFSTGRGVRFGIARFYNCSLVPKPGSTSYAGFGWKWGIRSRGLGRYDIRNCSFAPVLEHAIYVDSIQGQSWFKGIDHHGSTRTAIQIVNRSFDVDWLNRGDPDYPQQLDQVLQQFLDGTLTPQPTGFGPILIEAVTLRDLRGDGGGGITVAGHLGDVYIKDVNAFDSVQTPPFHGVITVWTDADRKKGTYLYSGRNGELFSCRSVTLENVNIGVDYPDREGIAISGAEYVRIRDFSSSIGNFRSTFSFDSSNGAPQMNNDVAVIDGVVGVTSERIENGRIDFFIPHAVSSYPGFVSNGKIKYGTSGPLSDAQIDALWPTP